MSADKGKHYAFYPSDWLAGTRGLTAAETGVYITLIAMMYEREAPLDMDRARLARLCGIPAGSFKKVLQGLLDDGKIIETKAGLWNARVEREVGNTRRKLDAARVGAEARWSSGERENVTTKPQSEKQKIEAYSPKKSSENSDGEMRPQSDRNANQNQNQNTTATNPLRGSSTSGSAAGSSRAEVPDEDPFSPQPGDDPPGLSAGDDLFDQVLAAVGVANGPLPTHWLPPAATIHVGKWRSQLGLTATEIIATARESRKRHDDPPRGPKALDRAMQATAAAKSTSFSASGGARPRSPAQGQRKPHWQVMAERDESERRRAAG